MKTQPPTLDSASRPFATKASSRKLVLALLMRLLWAASLVLPALGAQAAVVFTTLYSFTGTNDGANPSAALVQGSDGYFYGTTQSGGTNRGAGTVFKISTNGAYTSLYSFTGTNDGANPNGLVQGNDGYFYGTTQVGGMNGDGTVFKISPAGALTTLYAFGSITNGSGEPLDGANPLAALVQGSDGSFYGTTEDGGAYTSTILTGVGFGTVFKISTNGALTTLYSFGAIQDVYGDPLDGAFPCAGLVQGSDGNFYGTTERGGGDYDNGTVFQISTNGALTGLCRFANGGGIQPSGLVQGSDGNFYGTTAIDGYLVGHPFGDGTAFKIGTNGTVLNSFSFTGGTNGAHPIAGLVQASDGNFYGTTEYNGGEGGQMGNWGFYGDGTVFRINTNGALTTLYAFGSITNASGEALDGAYPQAALVQSREGSFYGTTSAGGTYDNGTVFRLTIVPDPQLTLIPFGQYVILTWPTDYKGFSYAGYTLQSTTNLLPPAVWTTNSPGPVVIGGQNVVINTISGTQRFYHLISP